MDFLEILHIDQVTIMYTDEAYAKLQFQIV